MIPVILLNYQHKHDIKNQHFLYRTITYIVMFYCTLPLGNPNCCSSLSSESPSTEYFAALDKIKDSAAIAALMSDSSKI